MTLREAANIVMELAHQNLLDDPDMPEQTALQREAFETMDNFLDGLFAPGSPYEEK